MYLTIKNYVSDGVQIEFAVPMTYIKKEYVRVHCQAAGEGGYYFEARREVDFTWVNAGLIRLSQPVPAGERIVIRRETYADAPLVDYQNAAILVEEDLDLAALQALHVAQEAREQNGAEFAETAAGLAKTAEIAQAAALDATQAADAAQTALVECRDSSDAAEQAAEGMTELRREVLDAVDSFSRDYATVADGLAGMGDALERAETARDQAEASLTGAVASAATAQTASAEARHWADEADRYAAAVDALGAAHVEKAMAWAENPPGLSVEEGKYSARHYADKASATGDLGSHVEAENPHPQYVRTDQNGSAFFEIDANGDIRMRENVQNGAADLLFHLDAVADVALNP